MLKLVTKFQDELGKKHNWSYKEPNPDLTPEEIREAMETLTILNLFEKNGVKMFQKVVSAKFVETVETPIFDLSKPTPEAYVADPNNVFTPQFILNEKSEVEENQVSEAKHEVPVAEESEKESTIDSLKQKNAAPVTSLAAKAIEEKLAEDAAPTVDEAEITSKTPEQKSVASLVAEALEQPTTLRKSAISSIAQAALNQNPADSVKTTIPDDIHA